MPVYTHRAPHERQKGRTAMLPVVNIETLPIGTVPRTDPPRALVITDVIRATKRALEKGRDIAIFSHIKSQLEEQYGGIDQIRLYNRLLATKFPPSVDVVLSTMRFGHAATRRIKSGNNLAVVRVVQERELQDILRACEQQLLKFHQHTVVDKVEYFTKPVQTHDANLQTQERGTTMDQQVSGAAVTALDETEKLQPFLASLRDHATKHGGEISKTYLAEIREEHHITANAQQLERGGLIRSIKQPGHRVGRYTLVDSVLVPTKDIYRRAELKIARKNELLTKQLELQEQIDAIDVELAEIDRLEKARAVFEAAVSAT